MSDVHGRQFTWTARKTNVRPWNKLKAIQIPLRTLLQSKQQDLPCQGRALGCGYTAQGHYFFPIEKKKFKNLLRQKSSMKTFQVSFCGNFSIQRAKM